ncbi:alcohol dehydrogenase 1 [Aspergillus bombycis]|uniref:Alcohol dehydrogenase 1 n=1 Tax=Aspergillus bombycis TaxID=109264 RepID=A0A1F7ZJN2_9EURO|nr:alcohol dehydrogenase 1 [Aspergillus bombycis]OGM39651.1 alcohol dehydrogenase 1 [Aspergillus bombycis]
MSQSARRLTHPVVKNEGPDFHVEIEKVPVPEIGMRFCPDVTATNAHFPGPEDVLIRLNTTGLCLSDVHLMSNDWNLPKMSAMGTKCAGHEGAGVIVKVGERVKCLKVGQRAGYKPIHDVCHTCEACKSGRETYCLSAIYTGCHVNDAGSYQEYIVSPERYTSLIPDGVSDYVAGPIMCSASTAYSSIKESGLRAGQWAVFLGGGGGVGIQGVQLASAMSLRVIAVDTGTERAALARKYGAEEFVDFKTEDPVKKVLELTGGGAHGVFVTAVQSYPIAPSYMGSRAGAKVMCIGVSPMGKYHVDLDTTQLIFRNQSVLGTLREVDLESNGGCLSKLNESVQKLKQGNVAGRIVLDFNMP